MASRVLAGEGRARSTPRSQDMQTPETEVPMQICQLHLATATLAAQRAFYTHVLGLPLIAETASSCTLLAGSTRLRFTATTHGQPRYHFAFNIPRNALLRAEGWLAPRTALLHRDGQAVFTFPSWDAQAIYFQDPAGNLVECIARQALAVEITGGFGPEHLLSLSEIGLPVDDLPAQVAALTAALHVTPYQAPAAAFAPLGDAQGLLIVVQRGRAWFPTTQPAEVAPVQLTILGATAAHYQAPHLPYLIEVAQAE
jgi:catechol-2,3-dioxygenase